MRVAGQTVGGLRLLLAEGVELLLAEPVQQERTGVDAGGGVTLEEDLVAGLAVRVLAPEEVVEAHVVQRRGRGEGGDVPTDADTRALRPGDHHGRVPAGRVEDLALDLLVAGEEGLVLGRDGVDVVRAAHLGHGDTLLAGALDQAEHQVAGALAPPLVDGRVKRLQPFRGLLGIEVRDLTRKAANDDRVAIGSGSHAVPSLSVETRGVSRRLHRVPQLGDPSSLPMGNRSAWWAVRSEGTLAGSVARFAHLRVLRRGGPTVTCSACCASGSGHVRDRWPSRPPGTLPSDGRAVGLRANRRLYARWYAGSECRSHPGHTYARVRRPGRSRRHPFDSSGLHGGPVQKRANRCD